MSSVKRPFRTEGTQTQASASRESRENSTGREFWTVAVHFANNSGKQGRKLRKKQAKEVASWATATHQQSGIPVIVAGDFNTSQRETDGYAAAKPFRKAGFFDTAHARKLKKIKWSTINHFAKPEDARLLAEFTMLKTIPGEDVKLALEPARQVAMCIDGVLVLFDSQQKGLSGVLVDERKRAVRCAGQETPQEIR